MWQCDLCNKAMWTSIPETVQTRHGHAQVGCLCLRCARQHASRQRWQLWKTTFGFLGVVALTGYVCYSFLLHS